MFLTETLIPSYTQEYLHVRSPLSGIVSYTLSFTLWMFEVAPKTAHPCLLIISKGDSNEV